MGTDPDHQFLQQADAPMPALIAKLAAVDPDARGADAAAGVVKMTFADGRVCVLNRQSAAHQIWLAEGASAWHFTRDADSGKWIDTKGRGDLHAVLSGILTSRLGRPIRL